MNNNFFEALAALVNDNSVETAVLIDKVKAAVLKAAQKAYPRAEDDDITVEIDTVNRRFKVFMLKSVVEGEPKTDYEVSYDRAKLIDRECVIGDLVKCEIDPVDFGRSNAQVAKQSLRTDVRAIKREKMLEKFESKEHQIITVKVIGVEMLRGTVTVEYDGTELYLSKNEQLFTEVMKDGKPERIYETFTPGQLVKVYVTTIANRDKKPIVRISRVHPGFVQKLFEMSIPEIASGIVTIHAVSREAGYRSKIAVSSNDPNVDAVSACIGPNGTRTEAILRELHGEKIDVIPYYEDPAMFITKALQPAPVLSAVIAEGEAKVATVIVPADQLTLAIGKRGQNAKLAAKLTGYKIDIKPEGYEEMQDQDEAEPFGGLSEEELLEQMDPELMGSGQRGPQPDEDDEDAMV